MIISKSEIKFQDNNSEPDQLQTGSYHGRGDDVVDKERSIIR